MFPLLTSTVCSCFFFQRNCCSTNGAPVWASEEKMAVHQHVCSQDEPRCWYMRDKWVTAAYRDTKRHTKMQRWGTAGEGGLDRCSASFALLRLKFRGCNCCQCRWVTGERRRWWCHRDCLACRAAAASFPKRSTFLRIVVKEMSSEQKPIWQLRVKWGEKSKSHSIWERLGGGAYPAGLRLSLRLFPRGSVQDGTPVPALWNKMLILSPKEHT